MRGDWNSLLIIDGYHIDRVIPMNPNTISECLRYYYGTKNDQLLDHLGNTVSNVFGAPILCLGSWSCLSNFKLYRGAITAVHKHRDNGMLYRHFCSGCTYDFKNYLKELSNGEGCKYHRFNSRHYPEGDPTTAQMFKNEAKLFNTKASKHVVNSCTQLTPSELRLLFDSMSTSNDVYDFMIYTMATVATALGLRHDEFASIKMQDFRCDLAMVFDTYIESLVVMVHGKSDNAPVPFKVYFEDEVPEFCPARMLLIWVWFLGLEGDGYLFPSRDELNEKLGETRNSTGASFQTEISYRSATKSIQVTIEKLLDNDIDPENWYRRNFGTHIFRKSFYLFGKLGGARHDQLKFSARHANEESALLVSQLFHIILLFHHHILF